VTSRLKHAGEISCFLFSFGAKTKTGWFQETGDSMIILTFIASTFANSVILGQLIYYWNKPAGAVKDAKAKKPKSKKDD